MARKKSLDSKDILSIIESCATHGVILLKLENLHLELGKRTQQEDPSELLTSETHPKPTEAAISEQQHATITQETLEEDELAIRDEQLAEMLLTDPQGAEEMLLNEELEDARDDRSDSDELLE